MILGYNSTPKYKRTKSDSAQQCPYCHGQFCFSLNLWSQISRNNGFAIKKCSHCGKKFKVFRNREVEEYHL